MHKIIYIVVLAVSLIHPGYASFKNSTDYEDHVISIEKYTVTIPEEFSEHTKGFSPGLGSSITMKSTFNDNHIQLYALCDRGPNYTIAAPEGQKSTIIFPEPTFSPFIGIIDIKKGESAILSEVISLRIDNQLITGLPTPTAQYKKGSLSVPTDFNFKYLPPDVKGIDPESLDIDKEGNFWIGDEYGPRIIKANGSGEILEILSPENTLPEILKNGPLNRGFEAIAVAPNGKVYAVMESILDFNGKTKNTANFMRMIEFDPALNQTRTFAYQFDQNTYRNNLSVKIGDLAVIDDTHFLIIEQGMTKSGMRNIIYIIDISEATDISNLNLPKENISTNSKVKCIKKTKLLDPRQYNWPHEKLEGIAIINESSIAITHDNDFGFALSINDVNSQDVEGYTVDNTTQKLMRYGKDTEDKVKVELDENSDTWIWIVNFKKTFLEQINTTSLSLKKVAISPKVESNSESFFLNK